MIDFMMIAGVLVCFVAFGGGLFGIDVRAEFSLGVVICLLSVFLLQKKVNERRKKDG